MTSADEYGPFSKAVRPYWKPVLMWVGLLVVVGILISIIGFFAGWFNAAKQVVSPGNVTAQFHDAYGRYENLKATTCNVKNMQTQIAATDDANAKIQLQSYLLAFEQNYNNIAAQYNAAYDNAFAAKHVGPSDLPKTAPVLSAALASASC